jgi:hypothetical protein
MQHKTARNLTAAGKQLPQLLNLYGCADVVAPVDQDAFGRRASELIKRGISTRWAATLKAADLATQATPRPASTLNRKSTELYGLYDAAFPTV